MMSRIIYYNNYQEQFVVKNLAVGKMAHGTMEYLAHKENKDFRAGCLIKQEIVCACACP